MKIAMLGHTGVGKTTFMAAMYGALQLRTNGFTIRASDDGDHTRLMALCDAIIRGEYPAGTSQRQHYELILRHNGDRVAPFSWTDHRGEDAMKHSDESDQVTLLVNDLAAADGIVVFFACDALSARRTTTSEIRRITSLLIRALNQRTTSAGLAIVLTKSDLVETMDGAVIDPIRSLIDCVKSSKHVNGTLISTACGRERIVNAALPGIFVLYIGLLLHNNTLVDEINGIVEKIERYDRTAGLLESLTSWWDGVASDAEIAQDCRIELRGKLAEYEKVKGFPADLATLLGDIPRF